MNRPANVLVALIPQVQMLSPLLDAEELKSRTIARLEFHSLYKTGSNCCPPPSNFRRQCEKEFVYSFRGQKLPEKCRPSFVKKFFYPKLHLQELKNRARGDGSTFRLKSMYLNGGQSRRTRFCEHIRAPWRRDQYRADP